MSTSFGYYTGIVKNATKGGKPLDNFTAGVKAVIDAYWYVLNAGKLPPLSLDDRDEALDRVMERLSRALKAYDPTLGTTVTGFVARTMRLTWLSCAHAVYQETHELQTGTLNCSDALYDDEVEYAAASASPDSVIDMTRNGSGEIDDEPPNQVMYAAPPVGLADPAHEAANLEHIEALERFVKDGNMTEYRRKTGASRNQAFTRKRTLTARKRA